MRPDRQADQLRPDVPNDPVRILKHKLNIKARAVLKKPVDMARLLFLLREILEAEPGG